MAIHGALSWSKKPKSASFERLRGPLRQDYTKRVTFLIAAVTNELPDHVLNSGRRNSRILNNI